MDKTHDDLEWLRLAEAVAARCQGPRRRRVELEPATTADGAARALAETREAMTLREAGEPLVLDGVQDIVPHLDRLGRQGALDGRALRDVGSTLSAARALRKFLGRRKERVPKLHEACAFDPTMDRLEEEISVAIEADGTVSSEATPELRALRTEVANLRGRLVARLDAIIEKRADILQDRYYTIREGRYVVPVRTDAHERLSGIVHGTSASGATVFVEPAQLVDQGNRLKMAEGEMLREENRILGLVSERVRDRLPVVRATVDALDHADLRAAAAQLGQDMGARIIPLSARPRAHLVGLKHPLLVLDGVDVVPSDVSIEAGHALIISGPNAGGKTIALKALGLAALMMRVGLPVCCEEGSECGFFAPVLTDVGDHQSLAANLSTFSAHVSHLARILEQADARALVLLDELAGSTDPQEGAALACAVTLALCEFGAATAVTTHYEPLKALAAHDSRLRNAAVGFDVARMEPTFVLSMDVAGSSSALAVAQRFGVPPKIVEAARERLPDQARAFESLVRELEEERRRIGTERVQLDEERNRLRQDSEDLAHRLEQLKHQSHDRLDQEATQLLESVRRARAEVEAARKRVRRERADEQVVREATRTVDAGAGVLQEVDDQVRGAPEPPSSSSPAEDRPIEAGARVWVDRLRSEADVLEVDTRGRLRVAAGAMKLWIDPADVRAVRGHDQATTRPGASPAPSDAVPARERPSADNTLDVRGLRVDEALAMAESFLDRLYGADQPVAYVVHGVGTGALRDAIRSLLGREATYVRHARPGTPEEGGERVTVVYLR